MTISHGALTEESDFNTYWYDERLDARSRGTITWSALTTPYEYASITTYSLQDGSPTSTYRTAGHSEVELSFIRSVFKEIDNLIEPEFVEVPSDQADIVLVSSLDDLMGGTAGGYFAVANSVSTSRSVGGEKIGYLTWRDYTGIGYLSSFEMGIISHEIGHALRLSHPGAGGEGGAAGGYNPDWNQRDSVMSYNPYEGTQSLFFRSLDIQALQSFWGAETNPGAAGWPATETIPSRITFLDKPIASVQDSASSAGDSGLTISQLDSESIKVEQQLLADEITNYWWYQQVANQIGGDSIMNIFIDQKGSAPASSKMRKVARLGSMSAMEAQFIRNIASEIDSASALDLAFVTSPKEADVVISAAKKMPRYSAFYDWGDKLHHLAWLNKNKSLTPLDQVKITASLLASAGMKESVDSSYSTFDTVMSWNGRDYYGLTEIDKLALSSMWGQP